VKRAGGGRWTDEGEWSDGADVQQVRCQTLQYGSSAQQRVMMMSRRREVCVHVHVLGVRRVRAAERRGKARQAAPTTQAAALMVATGDKELLSDKRPAGPAGKEKSAAVRVSGVAKEDDRAAGGRSRSRPCTDSRWLDRSGRRIRHNS
jgi:hypothetical protein